MIKKWEWYFNHTSLRAIKRKCFSLLPKKCEMRGKHGEYLQHYRERTLISAVFICKARKLAALLSLSVKLVNSLLCCPFL